MVNHKKRYLIDAAFIIDRTHKTFFGTPLFTANGKDHTFTFGCVRDFLRLRYKLGMTAGAFIVGKEAYSDTSGQNIDDLITILKELKIPNVYDFQKRGLQIINNICSQCSHIVTADRSFLQFCADDLIVVLPRESKQNEWDCMSSETVKAMMGITPKDVPSYLALTDSSSSLVLTNKQAMRLIELYGDIDSIYRNLEHIPSAQIRKALAENESEMRLCYTENRREPAVGPMPSTVRADSLYEINTTANRQLFRNYGFHSLLALLPRSSTVPVEVRNSAPSAECYHTVVDRKGLEQLESVVGTSKLCAIDAESDDKDPREGTLLGVSFAIKDGEAYFVPLIESDLKDLNRDDVLKALNRILNSGTDFIGHNIKYDYLLLRRCGVTIKRIYFDTMLAAYDCHGDWPFFNLPYIAKHVLGKEIKSYSDVVVKGSTFLELPLREMVNHACQDADVIIRLYPILSAQLKERSLMGQFLNHTMQMLQRLGNLEFDGIAVDVRRLDNIKLRLVEQSARLRSKICKMTGRGFDFDSQQVLSEVLREVANSGGCIGPRRITVSTLEQLAIEQPVARQIVEFKRLQSRIVRLESISAGTRDGRIYPLFNQIKSRAGLAATSAPSLFDIGGQPGLRSLFERKVRDLFVDTRRSLRALAQLTQDPFLRRMRVTKPKADSVTAKHPLLRNLDQDELLLSLAIGQSDSVLSRRFLIERSKIATIRCDLEKRYPVTFRWLNGLRRTARAKGYVTNGDLRKFIDGLKSSDIGRRERAMEYAVRWLIRY